MRRKIVVALVAAGFIAGPVAVAPAARASTCETGLPGGEVACAGFFAVMNLSCKVLTKAGTDPTCWA